MASRQTDFVIEKSDQSHCVPTGTSRAARASRTGSLVLSGQKSRARSGSAARARAPRVGPAVHFARISSCRWERCSLSHRSLPQRSPFKPSGPKNFKHSGLRAAPFAGCNTLAMKWCALASSCSKVVNIDAHDRARARALDDVCHDEPESCANRYASITWWRNSLTSPS